MRRKIPKQGKANKVDVPPPFRDSYFDTYLAIRDPNRKQPLDPSTMTPPVALPFDEQAWRPETASKINRALARMFRALHIARELGDDDFIKKADRLARSYLKQKNQDIADERPEAARLFRDFVSLLRTPLNFNDPVHARRIAHVIAFLIIRSPDEWSETIRARVWAAPDAAVESITEALKKLMSRTRPVDEEDIIRHALIAVGYPEDLARNFFSRLDFDFD